MANPATETIVLLPNNSLKTVDACERELGLPYPRASTNEVFLPLPKMKPRILCLVVLTLLGACLQARAVVLTIAKDGLDAVLSWTSAPGDKFIVQHRSDWDTNTVWTTLTNLYPAATATNRTTYRLVGVFPAANTNISQTGGGGSGGPPGFPMSSSYSSGLVGEPPTPSYPPLPWETTALNTSMSENLSGDLFQTMDLGQTSLSNEVTSGFYRVLGVPDFRNNFAGATFDGLLFLTMRFPEMEERMNWVELLVNGEPTRQMERYSQGTGTNYLTGVLFNSDRLTNGNYTLQMRSVLDLANGQLHSPVAELIGKPVSVTISNEVSFQDWPTILVGGEVDFEAQTVHAVASWTLDIYDAWDQWVQTIIGETTNGLIQASWDLQDAWDNPRKALEGDPFFYSELVVQPLASSGGSPVGSPRTNHPPVFSNDYPATGGWTVAYQDKEFRDEGGEESPQYLMRSMATNIMLAPWIFADFPSQLMVLPYANNTNQTEMTNQAPRNAAWGLMKTNGLRNPYVRNFYYHGHGSPTLIGGDWNDTSVADPLQAGAQFNPAGSRAFITSQWVHDHVTYNAYPANRFRFVFLDACETSVGNWPQAFGIPKQTNSLSHYLDMLQFPKLWPESRPSVFVGWEVVTGGSAEWGTVQGDANFKNSWIGDWGNGNRQSTGRPTLVEALKFGLEQSGWIPQGKLDETMRIYGYSAMRFRDYNRQGEWPP